MKKLSTSLLSFSIHFYFPPRRKGRSFVSSWGQGLDVCFWAVLERFWGQILSLKIGQHPDSYLGISPNNNIMHILSSVLPQGDYLYPTLLLTPYYKLQWALPCAITIISQFTTVYSCFRPNALYAGTMVGFSKCKLDKKTLPALKLTQRTSHDLWNSNGTEETLPASLSTIWCPVHMGHLDFAWPCLAADFCTSELALGRCHFLT